VGKRLLLDAESYTVIGVLSEDFQYPFGSTSSPDVFVPLTPDSRNGFYLSVFGRLKPGVTLAKARADIGAIFDGMASKAQNYSLVVMPLQDYLIKQARLTLLILTGAVFFVLLIACANVTNLLLARASERQTEIAIRLAMGASRWRLIRQLLTESLLLSVIGGGLGLLLALWGRDFLVGMIADWMPRAQQVNLDVQSLVFTATISILAGIILGLAPALASSQPNLAEAIKASGQNRTGGLRGNRLRSLLVVSEMALALALLIGAGLLIKSLFRLYEVKLGFDPENVLTMRLSLPRVKYTAGQPISEFFQQTIDRIRTLPGVESVGLIDTLPLTDEDSTSRFIVDGGSPSGAEIQASVRSVSEDYFRSMGIPLLTGRYLSIQDDGNAPLVAVVNETMAKRWMLKDEALGKRLRPNIADRRIEIVGVVADTRNSLLMRQPPEIYFPYRQSPRRTAFLTVRTAADPQHLIALIRKEVLAVDKHQPIYNIKTMEQRLSDATTLQRFPMVILIFFAGLALSLAVVGIYGVVSYLVAQRTREIGVRMALGAQGADVLKMVIGQGLVLASIGAALGLLGALGLTRLMRGLLFGVAAADPIVFAGMASALVAAAVAACYVPARRATKVDPIIALRCE
jgi:putative ABC transport system permease protein